MSKFLKQNIEGQVKAIALKLKPSLWLIVPLTLKEIPFNFSVKQEKHENQKEKDIIYGKK